MNNRMFQEEDENDVAVMEPPCITKKGKTVYLDDILEVVAGKGGRLADARNLCASGGGSSLRKDDGVEHTTMPQPAVMLNGERHTAILYRRDVSKRDVPKSSKEEMYINMAELVERMDKEEDLDLFDAAERVNGWIEQALKENRKITVSFKDAEASHGVMGDVIGDIYDHYPEEYIEENVKFVDIAWRWTGAFEDVVSNAKLYRDDPVAYAKLMDDLDKIMMGDY